MAANWSLCTLSTLKLSLLNPERANDKHVITICYRSNTVLGYIQYKRIVRKHQCQKNGCNLFDKEKYTHRNNEYVYFSF